MTIDRPVDKGGTDWGFLGGELELAGEAVVAQLLTIAQRSCIASNPLSTGIVLTVRRAEPPIEVGATAGS